MKRYKLCCMGFDGDIQIEYPEFNDEQKAWEYNDYIGSKWYFYPFRFLVTPSHKTVVGTCDGIPFAVGKRLATVQRTFKKCSEEPGLQDADVFRFAIVVNTWME